MKRTLGAMSFFALLLFLPSVVFGMGAFHKRNPSHGQDKHHPKGRFIAVQILAINDYHGHLEATTPGTVDGIGAGGAEYLSAKLNELRQGHKYSLTVAAGDLIGGLILFCPQGVLSFLPCLRRTTLPAAGQIGRDSDIDLLVVAADPGN
jgi:hypothetical protein